MSANDVLASVSSSVSVVVPFFRAHLESNVHANGDVVQVEDVDIGVEMDV